MASLKKCKSQVYCVRFRFEGRSFKRSLKTTSPSEANCGLAIVTQTLYRLRTGQLLIPPAIDVGDFVVSGGTLTAAPTAEPPAPSLDSVIEDYLLHIAHKAAPSYLAAQKTHFKHFRAYLKARVNSPITAIKSEVMQGFLDAQLTKWDPNTVNKQRITLVQLYKYAVKQRELLAHSPMSVIEKIPFGLDRPPFRTVAEIQAIIERGGLSDREEVDLWECLYLNPADIAQLLTLVRARARAPEGILLHELAAYTGMRRGEILNLRWIDVDLDKRIITARSRKQSRTRREVTRSIDVHHDLEKILRKWRKEHPKGQFVVCDEHSAAQLTPDQANHRFWQPLRDTTWCIDPKRNWFKIGFHTYRHSFASNLASAKVDQRVIDEFMGHTTEEMRKRYRHLFPSIRREAIDALNFRSAPSDCENAKIQPGSACPAAIN